ncbi:MAG: hypothetical protein CSA45_02335 [Gammaproteobacteria bacterium]|nr:MAG: hypothetical protein CSA45_02335 [Gammaproteobacteria bacterium]
MTLSFDRFRHSLSVKLVGVFLLTATILVGLLWTLLDITFDQQFSENIRPHFNKYLIALQEQIGSPPDLKTALRIVNDVPVDIIIEAPGYKWSSSGEFIDKNHLDVKLQRIGETGLLSESGFYKQHFILRIFDQGHITSFIITESPDQWLIYKKIGIIVGVTLLVIALLYFAIHILFRPVGQIERGIRIIGGGQISHRLTINRKDEFGSLSTSINQMAANIENMLEAKHQLLLAISHELRTPITRAKIALSMLDDSAAKESIVEDIEEMQLLIHELLESERMRGQHAIISLKPTDINELIYQTQGRFFADAPLTLELAKSLPIITVDAKRIGLAIKNLIKNALTASKKPTDPVTITTSTRSDKLLITVTDQGVGIDKKHLKKVTEPFYRTDSSRQRKTGGFGIGLYLIKEIIQAHHGELILTSEPGKGTRASIVLPMQQQRN